MVADPKKKFIVYVFKRENDWHEVDAIDEEEAMKIVTRIIGRGWEIEYVDEKTR